MTDVEDVRRKKQFRSLRRLFDRTDTLGQLDRRLHGASATQARLFAQYKQAQAEKHEARGLSRHSFSRGGRRVYVWRDRKGRFARG